MRKVYLQCHQQIFCWSDDWIDLSLEQVEELQKNQVEKEPPVPKQNKRLRGWLRARL